MKFVAALMATASLALSLPSAAAAKAQVDTVDLTLPTQLPRTAVPHHYSISVTPHPERLTFAGSVGIDLEHHPADPPARPERGRSQACFRGLATSKRRGR